MSHPFDRYAPFTDVAALKEASERPLRKSQRVNTLKGSVAEFLEWAEKKGWKLEPVPWCPEGFFVDRENRETALGKDLLHLLGHTYMQEAASMLPVELLDVQQGHVVLDMAAAPGSKTTQIASKIVSRDAPARGIIIANDVQEKRLWTLKAALHRCGVAHNIVTKKVGQWFGRQMTERFDRVLCDAPCTAQGTARKDSDALLYSSEENAGKMARLQKEMLEAAVHAAKVGGVIVYSTCTLTPEENEGVIAHILNKFSDQVEPLEQGIIRKSGLESALDDSHRVQRHIGVGPFPALRLWPQTFDTEGFFAAVLRKTAPTRAVERLPSFCFQEDIIPKTRQKELVARLEDFYGTSFMLPGERLFQRGTQLILSTEEIMEYPLPVQDYALGMPFGRRLDDGRVRIDHEIASLRGHLATRNVININEALLDVLLDGKDASCDPQLRGDILLRYGGMIVGFGLAKEGKLLNRLPRWIIQKS